MEKLSPEHIENILALTPLQEGMLFHYLQDSQSRVYFEQLSLEISGGIDLELFEKAWNKVIGINEMLRTVFRWEKLEKPSQIILKGHRCEIKFHDLVKMDKSRSKAALDEIKAKDRDAGFDLTRVPFRVLLCKLGEAQYQMTISNHHILYDGWSNGILLKEFFSAYHELFHGGGSVNFPEKPSFKEFIKWIQSRDINKQEHYWREYLAGLETAAELPIKKRVERAASPGDYGDYGNYGDYTIILEEEIKGKLDIFVKNNRVTLASVFYSAWGILLQKYCDSGDVVFGTPVSGRGAALKGIKDMVGLFINTVPLRMQSAPTAELIDIISAMENDLKMRTEFESTPLPEIRSYSTVDGSGSLFDTLVVIENYPLDNRLLPENSLLSITSYSMVEMTHYDLSVGIMPFNEIEIKFSFKQELFEKEIIENLAGHFNGIIQNIITTPGMKISQLEIISPGEKNRILYEFNNTAAEYRRDKTIHQLFEEQASKAPDRIALHGCMTAWMDGEVGADEVEAKKRRREEEKRDGMHLSYRELNEQSNRLAGVLIGNGVHSDTIVGIMIERSIEMIIGILGILKSGGAYLPIDPEYPQERIDYMLKDSSAVILLTDEKKTNCQLSIVNYQLSMGVSRVSLHPSSFILHSSNLAYIIYTSGSTGRPKGVMINHGSVVNLLFAMQDRYPFTPANTYLLKTSYTFDVSVAELFGWYMGGGRLAILETNGEKNPDAILNWIHLHQVTHINFVPSMFNAFLDFVTEKNRVRLRSLRYVFLAGEALLPMQVKKFLDLNTAIELKNIYGPTEGTVYSSQYSLPGSNRVNNIPIGKPLPNIELYILNKHDHLQPLGVAGELCITGVGLSRGYLNRVELTHEKFKIINYKLKIKNGSGALRANFSPSTFILHYSKLYRTGDLARWLSDGNIEFLGRIDYQVKIRGFRIEPGEIENRLLNNNKIKKAKVLVRETKKGDVSTKALCAYIVVDKEFNLPPAELRKYLLKELPAYMVPAYFITLAELPLTLSGKVDPKLFPPPVADDNKAGREDDEPQNFIEQKMVEIWKKVLGRNAIGINDDFFLIGGDSIKSIQISAQMNREGLRVEVKDILNYPTISRVAPFVKKISKIADQSEVVGQVPLTPIQREFFSSPFLFPHHFNMSTVLYFSNGIEEEILRTIFTKIIKHHDVLRMVFKEQEGRIVQENLGIDCPLWLQIFNYRNREDGRNAFESKANEIQASLNLSEGPLMKLGLFQMNDGDRLLIVLHHLIIDGLSWRILFEDIETLHQQYLKKEPLHLPLKSGSYKRWAENLSQYAIAPAVLVEKEYWMQQAALKVPALKRDFAERNIYVKDTSLISFELGVDETELLLTKVNYAFNTEINDILLTGLGLGLKKSFGSNCFLIALEGHGREEIFKYLEVNRTVGWFTAKYPVILNISHENDLGRQIKEIKEILHGVPNKGIGYGILKYLSADRETVNMHFESEPQIIFNYEGQFDAELQQLSAAKIEKPVTTSMAPDDHRSIDFNISGIIVNKQLMMSITYNGKQYKRETIEALWNNYKNALKQVIYFCSTREEKELTPCDFTYKKLSLDMVEQLRIQYPIKDIYRLSPMQEGMLFHTLKGDHASTYLQQISYRIHGHLNLDFIKKSLNELFKRYEVLRTIFYYEKVDSPIQVVLKERPVEFYYKDLRHIATGKEKNKCIDEFKVTDRQCTFDLSNDVLLRLAIFQVNDVEHEFIWSFHHILLDGWSIGILNEDFFKIYKSLIDNRTYRLSPPKSFRSYSQWLESRSQDESRRFWNKYLAGYTENSQIPRTKSHPSNERYINEQAVWILEKEKTKALEKLTAENRVTLNTVIKTVWGLVLGKNCGKNDVVFGIVVSGRPPEIDGMESMVGCFINTIPFRLQYNGNTGFKDLLRAVQFEAVESEAHHYYPLAEIQAQSPLNQKLMDHLLVFENYPTAGRIAGVSGESGASGIDGNNGEMKLKITDVEIFEQVNYDFYIMLLPGEDLTIVLKYNAALYEKELINKLGDQYLNLLRQISNSWEINIEELKFLKEEKRKELLTAFNDDLDDLENE